MVATTTLKALRCGSRAAASNRAIATAPPTLMAGSPRDKVHMHDLHATILHALGMDHERLTYRYAGRDFRLTDVHGSVVRLLLKT